MGTTRQIDYRKESRHHNSTFALGGVSCFKESFVLKVPPFDKLPNDFLKLIFGNGLSKK